MGPGCTKVWEVQGGGCMVVYSVHAESRCILRGGQKHGRRGGKVGLGL